MDGWISQLYTHTTILNSKYLKATNFAGGSLTYTVYPMVTSSFTEWTTWFRPLEPSAWSHFFNVNLPSHKWTAACPAVFNQTTVEKWWNNRSKKCQGMYIDIYPNLWGILPGLSPSRLYMAVYPHDLLMKSHSITMFMVKPSTPILKSPGGPIRCAGEGRWRRPKPRQAGGAGGTLLPRWGRCSLAWDWFKRKWMFHDFPWFSYEKKDGFPVNWPLKPIHWMKYKGNDCHEHVLSNSWLLPLEGGYFWKWFRKVAGRVDWLSWHPKKLKAEASWLCTVGFAS